MKELTIGGLTEISSYFFIRDYWLLTLSLKHSSRNATLFRTKCSRMHQVKFVEDSL